MSASTATLTASYSSPSGNHAFNHTLPSPSADNVNEKTAYLSTLRANCAELQSEVNTFLTQKMEEDVEAAAAAGGAKKRSKKEEREEEMYGEEDPEADD